MRKKTAKQTTKRRTGSSPQHSGLIVKGKNPQRSTTTKSTLDNRSHRTGLRISCERELNSCKRSLVFISLTMRTYQSLPPRSSASCAS